jgi:hypothetical protein
MEDRKALHLREKDSLRKSRVKVNKTAIRTALLLVSLSIPFCRRNRSETVQETGDERIRKEKDHTCKAHGSVYFELRWLCQTGNLYARGTM